MIKHFFKRLFIFLRMAAVRPVDTICRYPLAGTVWLLTRPVIKVVDMQEYYKRLYVLRH